ncbi:cytochrome c peroxidase [Methylomicrobium album BG8]|uniref:Cytochrome c peroxidase n=2 Tax=Methylomicrobium album TaxID=39775 RepID=H8GPE2_METAL|nr:cytochrome c peroxidase [Methylomicrobium album BG8]
MFCFIQKVLSGIAPCVYALILLCALADAVFAHGALSDQVMKGFKVPTTPKLIGKSAIVVDQQAAVQLGKALFWDGNVGSSGTACASCHFHAGSDIRHINQLNPGQAHTANAGGTAKTFELPSGNDAGPDYELKAGDFPFFRFADVDDIATLTASTDDVAGSSGEPQQQFVAVDATGINAGINNDQCDSELSAVFHAGSLNTRQVTKRNAPTVINAAFNFRNFWDGRANNVFNGQSPFGLRDTGAKIWLAKGTKKVKAARLALENASLASQAVGPPLDMVEMSCKGRSFADIGRKLLRRRALESQAVHPEDSVLAGLRDPSGTGLTLTYDELIKKAFNKKYWRSAAAIELVKDSGQFYSQMEANFAMFFGLAIQQYENTLISDDALFDREVDDDTGFPAGFTEAQQRGFQVFNDAHCNNCHSGPTFSSAASPQIFLNTTKKPKYLKLVNRDVLGEQASGFGTDSSLFDIGFAITSVAPTAYDVGLGGTDPFGNPLSFTKQYIDVLAGNAKKMLDPVIVVTCDMVDPFTEDYLAGQLINDKLGKSVCKGPGKKQARIPTPEIVAVELAKSGQGRLSGGVGAAFKIPTLRNVELTGPYMHNGGMKSLEEVVEFYNRGGNLTNPRHSTTLVFFQGMSAQDKSDLVAFLKTLTDERVRWERAPFDHPALQVPHGHEGGENPLGSGLAGDRFLEVPAVGRNGRTPEMGPLKAFDSYLEP